MFALWESSTLSVCTEKKSESSVTASSVTTTVKLCEPCFQNKDWGEMWLLTSCMYKWIYS